MVTWGRLTANGAENGEGAKGKKRRRQAPGRNSPIAFVMREDLPYFLMRDQGLDEAARGLSSAARDVLRYLEQRGASFMADIIKNVRRMPVEVEDALWELVSHGFVSGDGVAGLRQLMHSGVRERGRRMQASGSGREGRMAAIIGLDDAALPALIERASAHGVFGVANRNAPGQVVVSGERAAIDAATEIAKELELEIEVLDPAGLSARGYQGILRVGQGSAHPPRMVILRHVPHKPSKETLALVGKGITFDSGGISIKTVEQMKLMRKDMGGAAAVCGAVLGAADLELPVRVTALAPLAENMISGASVRPGDVVRHYGGLTTEVQNTDAEGRLVLGDALAYAARRLKPDLLVDLATLTGASHVALGKRTAALFTHNDAMAAGLAAAGKAVGERTWRMPLPDDYVASLASDIADLNNAPPPGQAGAVVAALYLREFTGDRRDRWVHVDMSAPAWIETHDGPLVKGATGWGVRMLLRWLESL